MDLAQFADLIVSRLRTGVVLQNPGGGTSTVLACTRDGIKYRRGSSPITVKMEDLHRAWVAYSGTTVSTSDLAQHWPSVFNSQARPAGHSCNCTFLFLLLEQIGLADAIEGEGKRGSPFRCRFFSAAEVGM